MLLRNSPALFPALHGRDRTAVFARQFSQTTEGFDHFFRWRRHVDRISFFKLRKSHTLFAYDVNVEGVNVFCVKSDMAEKATFISTRVRELRDRAGMSLDELARAMGYKGASSIQRYENPDGYKKEFLTADLAHKFAKALVGKGNPPIVVEEVWALFRADLRERPKLIGSYDPDDLREDVDADADLQGAGIVNGRLRFEGKINGSTPEIAAKAGAGLGQVDQSQAVRIETHGIATGHHVVDEWVLPAHYVRSGLNARPGQVVILPVIGHSMEPILSSNDRILVDTSQNTWMGDAVYVIDDGDAVLQVKTLRKLPSSQPPRYRVVSEANPEAFWELDADQFRIIGRVVGRFSRM